MLVAITEMECEIFGFSSTNSIPIDADLGQRDWSPGINWNDFTVADDFHYQIDSTLTAAVDLHDWYTFVSPCSPAEDHTPSSDDTAVRLLRLLIAAAESLTGDLKSPALTEAILARLRELLLARTTSTSFERLAIHFTNVEERVKPSEFLRAFLLMQDISPCFKFAHFTANQAILESLVDGIKLLQHLSSSFVALSIQ